MTTPTQSLEAGVETLREVLEPYGFRYEAGAAGSSSGGPFASGAFLKANRMLELSVRYGLGQVEYTFNAQRIGHEDYLRYAGHWGQHRYPAVGHTVQESFTALAEDLKRYFGDFVSGDGALFNSVVQSFQAEPKRFKGFAALSVR